MKSLKQYIIEHIEKIPIFEMVINRLKYMDRLENTIRQIMENWCLIKCCSLTNSNFDLRAHWYSELSAHLFNIYYDKIKNDNSFKIKQSATKQMYMEYDELDTDEDRVYSQVIGKFNKEKLFSDDIIRKSCELFCNDIEKICELISQKQSKDASLKLTQYIYEEI